MHYYSFNINDYKAATDFLTFDQDLIYRRILDHYYITEKPIEKDIDFVAVKLRIVGYEDDLKFVLKYLFEEKDDGWHNSRCDEEISVYHKRIVLAKENGSKGGRKKQPNPNPTLTQPLASANPTLTQPLANQEPVTSNHNSTIDKSIDRDAQGAQPPTTNEQENVEVVVSFSESQEQWVQELSRNYPDLDVAACLQDFLRFVRKKQGNPSRNGFIGFLKKCSPKIIDTDLQERNRYNW